MTKSPKPAPSAPPQDPNALTIHSKDGEKPGVTVAKALLHPRAAAAVTTRAFSPLLKDSNLDDVVQAISDEITSVEGGSMDGPEAMLTAQAHTLDAMFHAFAQKAVVNMGASLLHATDTYMRMALKAQSQCRTTLEALAEIKYPKSATFIRQANIAGQQQVNNGTPALPAREKNVNPRNELLEATHGERLDFGAAGAAIGINQNLEAVGSGNRAGH